jgi:RNase P/RNase MRP subunit p29
MSQQLASVARRLAMAVALGLAMPAASAVGQTAPPIQTVQPERLTVTGRVAEVFANRFILATERERLLVEPADPSMPMVAAAGESVTVEGERFGAVVKAARVDRLPGAVVATPPQGPEDIPAVLRRLGLTAVDAPVTKKHHVEVLARMADGRSVYVSFDRGGRLWEIEDAAHDRDAAVPRNLSRADYDRLARDAGFSPTGGFEEKRRHVEVDVLNRSGERLVLHIDRGGTIYKQVWPREAWGR